MAAESKLENRCRVWVRSLKGRLAKWVSPGWDGVPDRVLLLPKIYPIFVEFKAPGEKLRPSQELAINWLLENGKLVWVVDNEAQFKKLVEDLIHAHSREPSTRPDPSD